MNKLKLKGFCEVFENIDMESLPIWVGKIKKKCCEGYRLKSKWIGQIMLDQQLGQ